MNLEEQIRKDMDILGISRQEAISMIVSDTEIDRMTSAKQILNDLTTNQQQVSKQAKSAGRKPSSYNFDTSKRKRHENEDKRILMQTLKESLDDICCDDITVTNIEREIEFVYNDTKYKLVLSAPRN